MYEQEQYNWSRTDLKNRDIKVKETTLEDCEELSRTMRKMDKLEVSLVTGDEPLLALLRGRALGNCLTASSQGKVFAIFGHSGVPNGIGVPWMLGSDAIATEVRKPFIKYTKAYTQEMLKHYDCLTNYVYTENKVHIRWLKWLGFTVDAPILYGRFSQPFHPFIMFNHIGGK